MTGKEFENWISGEFNRLIKEGRVIAWQLPTPYNITRDLGKGRFEGQRQRSTIDFLGAVEGSGRLFAIEAKASDNGKLSISYSGTGRGSGVKRHQLNTLAQVAKIGGVALIVVHDSKTAKTYALPVDQRGKIGSFKIGIKTVPLATVEPIYQIDSISDAL